MAQNENAISFAFPIEGNSGMNNGDLAELQVIAPIWWRFLSTYPEVHLELAVLGLTVRASLRASADEGD
jgi:hypothetical protein